MPGVNCLYVRISVSAVFGGSGNVGISEIQIFDTNNVNLATGGTATALTGTAANAFDGNTATEWDSTSPPSGGTPQWIQYQFASAQNVVSVSIRNSNISLTSSPSSFLIQTSPDGTTWTTQNTLSGFSWSALSQLAFFDASTIVGKFRLSQQAIEVVNVPTRDARLSQLAVETVLNAQPRAKISQVNVETLLNAQSRFKLSQITVEIIYPNVVQTPKAVQQFLLP